jgi:predicted ATPase
MALGGEGELQRGHYMPALVWPGVVFRGREQRQARSQAVAEARICRPELIAANARTAWDVDNYLVHGPTFGANKTRNLMQV